MGADWTLPQDGWMTRSGTYHAGKKSLPDFSMNRFSALNEAVGPIVGVSMPALTAIACRIMSSPDPLGSTWMLAGPGTGISAPPGSPEPNSAHSQ